MEAAGVAQAGHLNGAPVAIIRGISDRADGTKNSTDDRNWQPQAAANAAAFAIRLAVELTAEQEEAPVPRDGKAPSADRLGRHVSNTTHNSTVGIMAGSVTGSSVHMNTAPQESGPVNLIATLNRFRGSLRRHHAEDALDEDTYREALADLDSALRSWRKHPRFVEAGDHDAQETARTGRGVPCTDGRAGPLGRDSW